MSLCLSASVFVSLVLSVYVVFSRSFFVFFLSCHCYFCFYVFVVVSGCLCFSMFVFLPLDSKLENEYRTEYQIRCREGNLQHFFSSILNNLYLVRPLGNTELGSFRQFSFSSLRHSYSFLQFSAISYMNKVQEKIYSTCFTFNFIFLTAIGHGRNGDLAASFLYPSFSVSVAIQNDIYGEKDAF